MSTVDKPEPSRESAPAQGTAGTMTPPDSGTTAVLFTLADGVKVKQRLLRMRACNERNAKGKVCAGHLKRWYQLSAEAREKFGPAAELYRCEHCHTIYLPNPAEPPRTGTLAW